MKIAYLIIAHTDPNQVLRLIHSLRSSRAFFVIHIDKRAGEEVYGPLRDYAATHPELILTKRYRCYWGQFGIANAMIECIKLAIRANRHFDYAVLLSGRDYPIKNAEQIAAFFEQNKGKEFMESFPLAKPNRWSQHGGCFQSMARVRYWTFFVRSRSFQIRASRKFPFGGNRMADRNGGGCRETVSCTSNRFYTKIPRMYDTSSTCIYPTSLFFRASSPMLQPFVTRSQTTIFGISTGKTLIPTIQEPWRLGISTSC